VGRKEKSRNRKAEYGAHNPPGSAVLHLLQLAMVSNPSVVHGARCARQCAIVLPANAVLLSLLLRACLQHDGLITQLKGKSVAP
jgi:hypothetical protein